MTLAIRAFLRGAADAFVRLSIKSEEFEVLRCSALTPADREVVHAVRDVLLHMVEEALKLRYENRMVAAPSYDPHHGV